MTLVVRGILVARPSAFGGARYAQLPAAKRKDPTSAMLDQLRREIQIRLDELLGEADKLCRALAALGSRDGGAPRSPSGAPSPALERTRRRATRSAPASRTVTPKPARPRPSASATASSSSLQAAQPLATAPAVAARTTARPAPGSTKTAVLQALAGGNAMTAGEVATATGLGRASVSTTLSKLANNGKVSKAARGYQLAGQTAAGAPAAGADSAASADSEQQAG